MTYLTFPLKLTLRILSLKHFSKLIVTKNSGWHRKLTKHQSRCNSFQSLTNFFHRQQFSYDTDVDVEKNANELYRSHTNTNEKISCTNNNNNNNNSRTSFQFNDDYNFSLPTTEKDSERPVKRKSSVARRVALVVSCFLVILTLSVVTLVWYYMGWIYGVQAILVAIIAVLGASGIWRLCGHWIYIAAVTGLRDLRWVFWIFFFIRFQDDSNLIFLVCDKPKMGMGIQRLCFYIA